MAGSFWLNDRSNEVSVVGKTLVIKLPPNRNVNPAHKSFKGSSFFKDGRKKHTISEKNQRLCANLAHIGKLLFMDPGIVSNQTRLSIVTYCKLPDTFLITELWLKYFDQPDGANSKLFPS